jgi:hypothetical protein
VSTILFNLDSETAMRATTTNPARTIFNRMTQCTAHADDDVIIGRNVNALKQAFTEFAKARNLHLAENIQKTKYMSASLNMKRFKEATMKEQINFNI